MFKTALGRQYELAGLLGKGGMGAPPTLGEAAAPAARALLSSIRALDADIAGLAGNVDQLRAAADAEKTTRTTERIRALIREMEQQVVGSGAVAAPASTVIADLPTLDR